MKKTYTIVIIILSIVDLQAQQLPYDNQYLVNKFSLSSAYAGYTDNTELFMGFRQNWIGVPGAPQKQLLNINFPVSTKGLGLGFSLNNETTGNFSNFYFQPAIAYHLKLADEISIHFGINGELFRNQYNFSQAQSATIDPLIQTYEALKGTTFNVGASFMFQFKGLNLGVSVPRTLNSVISYNPEIPENKFTLVRNFIGYLSYQQSINKKWKIEPFILVRSTEKSPLLYEANFLAKFDDRLWATIGYRKDNNFILSAGASLTKHIVLNYTYEFATQGIVNYSTGTHEISLGFLLKRSKKQSPPPTIFRFATEGNQQIGRDTLLQKQVILLDAKVKKLQNQLSQASSSCDCDDLDRRIKKLEGNLDKLDAESWEKPFIINNIKFGNNSANLFASSFPELRKLSHKMKLNPDLILKISGYTDSNGSKSYNMRLSKKRADAVKAFLVREGIEAERIVTEGKGPSTPIADNKTPAGRAKNRRIEGQFKQNK